MPRQTYPAREAAALLGISLDTLRRWDRAGKISVERDASNRRVVSAGEIDRLRGSEGHISARNRFGGTVTDVTVDGLMARVELVVTEPVRLLAPFPRDAGGGAGVRGG